MSASHVIALGQGPLLPVMPRRSRPHGEEQVVISCEPTEQFPRRLHVTVLNGTVMASVASPEGLQTVFAIAYLSDCRLTFPVRHPPSRPFWYLCLGTTSINVSLTEAQEIAVELAPLGLRFEQMQEEG